MTQTERPDMRKPSGETTLAEDVLILKLLVENKAEHILPSERERLARVIQALEAEPAMELNVLKARLAEAADTLRGGEAHLFDPSKKLTKGAQFEGLRSVVAAALSLLEDHSDGSIRAGPRYRAQESASAMEALKAEPMVRVKECPHGRGVFAQRDLKAGETLAIYFGVGIPEFQIPDKETSELAWTNFIDHSETPNTMFAIDTKRKITVYLVTRNIGKGEELLMDYYDYYDKGTIDKALAPTDAEQDGEGGK